MPLAGVLGGLRYRCRVHPSPARTALRETPSLRERKKARTRESLIDGTLTSFAAKGFDAVTLDEICSAADVSKRTFFRTFACKEDVATAPVHDMWRSFVTELAT
ncbi:TetR/AcrR family transcriptional regulator [Rhodococcus wratislaviensis]|uniref:HTH tetR-type domain-containing protein n=1 Tax=Rhodococcus wratislaviensis NBRC 100605 TaxID=1219028 RepID=X0Q9D0_RHOWR|nr:TetR family transcriptional regulator [Rhodococcus wratislaviensis]GAF47506.1 hypothetical protein RW1_041_00520 [Rhodococcus wratislaviensis NBRC 100605]